MRAMNTVILIISLVVFMPLAVMAKEKLTMTDTAAKIKALEKASGGRLGVAVLDTENGTHLEYRGQERFAMCSTYKLLETAAILARVDAGTLSLSQSVPYGATDMQPHSPITEKHLQEGKMSIAALNAASLQYSDNTAANLLYRHVDGPQGLTAYIRSLGDKVTRFDRIEVALNTNLPEDVRDTTTPLAMIKTMETVLLDNALSVSSKKQLVSWLAGNTTGDKRLRAAMPSEWKMGDKTGTGNNGATNDVAIVWPPHRKPLLISVFYSESKAPVEKREAVIAKVGQIIFNQYR